MNIILLFFFDIVKWVKVNVLLGFFIFNEVLVLLLEGMLFVVVISVVGEISICFRVVLEVKV